MYLEKIQSTKGVALRLRGGAIDHKASSRLALALKQYEIKDIDYILRNNPKERLTRMI